MPSFLSKFDDRLSFPWTLILSTSPWKSSAWTTTATNDAASPPAAFHKEPSSTSYRIVAAYSKARPGPLATDRACSRRDAAQGHGR